MNTIKYSLVASMAIMLLTGCGGGDDNTEPTVEITNDTFDMYGTGVGTRKEPAKATFGKKDEFAINTIPITYKIKSLTANACNGEAQFSPKEFTIDANTTQDVSFSILFGDSESKKCITDKISFTYDIFQGGMNIFKDKKYELENPAYDQKKVTTKAGEDPLYEYQWHLKNNGSNVGAVHSSDGKSDINVESVWKNGKGITGKGVKVAVIDEGVDMFHPDLKDNLSVELSHNYREASNNPNNPTPHRMLRFEGEELGGWIDYPHGTAVAGIIGAKGWNGIGTRGVAPNATLVSYNALETWFNKDTDEAKELFKANKVEFLYKVEELQHIRILDALKRNLQMVDIYNNSYGSGMPTLIPFSYRFSLKDDYKTQLEYGLVHGRSGKGAIYVKSAGNNPKSWSNFEPDQTNGYLILVGASGADGKATSYTTQGPNILVNAPAGEVKEEGLYAKPLYQRIITTDMAGKQRGMDYQLSHLTTVPRFEVAGNENGDYTNLMSGTSSSAPIVSGVAALMLEANPDLTWRDVRYILAHSAYKNDGSNPEWKKNGAGLWYNNAYGFGMVDAKAAVTMAQEFKAQNKTFGGFHAMKHAKKEDIKSNSVNINKNIKVESVVVNLSLDLNGSSFVTSQNEYNEYNYQGTTSTTTGSFYLAKGDAVFKISSVFPTDDNSTMTNMQLIEDDKMADDSTKQDLGTLTFFDPKTKRTKVSVPKSGQYKIIVDSNATKWSVNVVNKNIKTALKKDDVKVTLTSPSGTKSILAKNSQVLDVNSTYSNAKLSSVQFMDENSKGNWTLSADANGSSIPANWSIDIMGH